MLAASTAGQAASSVVVNGPAFLIPALHLAGMSLATAGVVVSMTIVGSTCTLVLWGIVVDAVGERFVLLSSLGISATAVALAVPVADKPWAVGGLLLLAGAASAGTASASGRVVVGWFPPERRGTAMGIRQTSQPIGVGVAAIAMPVVADRVGLSAALAVPALCAAVAAVAVALVVIDPPRPPRHTASVAQNPYRGDRFLLRIHLVSLLLVVPQFTVWTFTLVWLQIGRDWSPEAAGAAVAVAQVLGAASRIAAGSISDRVGSRTRPLRWISVAAGASMLLLGGAMAQGWWIAVPLMGLASAITVADNGLAFTAVAERAGPFWSGRALGLQNTGQYLTASLVPPLAGTLVPLIGYGATFALSGLFPIVAVRLVPRRDPQRAP